MTKETKPKRSRQAAPKYKTTDQIRAMVTEGERFATRLTEDLIQYVQESAVRLTTDAEYIDGLSENTVSVNPELMEMVKSDRDNTAFGISRARAAIEELQPDLRRPVSAQFVARLGGAALKA